MSTANGQDKKRSGEPVLSVRNLQTHFFLEEGVVKAVDGVSFDVHAGETVGIVGESGCGKSVTALSILRLVASPPGRVVGGEIIYQGRSLLEFSGSEMRSIRGNEISMIFQEPMTSHNPVFTVGDQIIEAISLHQKKKAADAGLFAIDYKFSIIQRRLSILAVILFTINIYGLNLPSFLAGFFILSLFPTLTAVLFGLLFVLYLAVIWYHAHPVHRMLGSTGESRRSFIWSNIAFSIPVLIPWFIISLASDLLALMPFDSVKHLRNNPAGEMAFFIVFLLAIAVAAPAMIQRFWRCRRGLTGTGSKLSVKRRRSLTQTS